MHGSMPGDSDEKTVELFKCDNIYKSFLMTNSLHTQNWIMPYYKKLVEKSCKKIHDIIVQIGIAVGRINGDGDNVRKVVSENPEKIAENATACRRHIENLLSYRENMRGWLRELLSLM